MGWPGESQRHAMSSRRIFSTHHYSRGKRESLFEIEEEPYEKYVKDYPSEMIVKIRKILDAVFRADNEYEEEVDSQEVGIFDVKLSLTDNQLAKKVAIKNVNRHVVKAIRDGRTSEIDWYGVLEMKS